MHGDTIQVYLPVSKLICQVGLMAVRYMIVDISCQVRIVFAMQQPIEQLFIIQI